MTETADQKRPRGRPRKPPAKNFNFRLADSLRARLGEAAEKSGCTITEEIARRLERSFEDAQPVDLASLRRQIIEEGRKHSRSNKRALADWEEKQKQVRAILETQQQVQNVLDRFDDRIHMLEQRLGTVTATARDIATLVATPQTRNAVSEEEIRGAAAWIDAQLRTPKEEKKKRPEKTEKPAEEWMTKKPFAEWTREEAKAAQDHLAAVYREIDAKTAPEFRYFVVNLRQDLQRMRARTGAVPKQTEAFIGFFEDEDDALDAVRQDRAEALLPQAAIRHDQDTDERRKRSVPSKRTRTAKPRSKAANNQRQG